MPSLVDLLPKRVPSEIDGSIPKPIYPASSFEAPAAPFLYADKGALLRWACLLVPAY